MNDKNNSKLTNNSQKLRKNMTIAERHLWYDFLKHLPITFNRQKVVGNYIVDFYCAQAQIVIELDGVQHQMQENQTADTKRDEMLNSMGITVLRYNNENVMKNFVGVCNDILEYINPLINTL